MQSEHFDLNDIQHEPTDQQLKTLMMLVAVEARRRAEAARRELMARLRAEIAAANRSRESAWVKEQMGLALQCFASLKSWFRYVGHTLIRYSFVMEVLKKHDD